ncbi:GNAT family N-acetyltransferase [Robertkochia marina]|uniref:GNAT family N-acetyltransferase n=1 Tax=Robertkochia marina TaxID=1227945 RepID=A0A4S3M023_9FLAO|nr:GNAT family N-acetyltransferase [Robertkochia marina]THD67724.1 GNAT family N-acetyltransferase [Robertkochia marina]TRZ43455.1 GNAT family N-acetyltransferase [Robertkochia marina]
MESYKVLKKQIFNSGDFEIQPIRFQDRFQIKRWRNAQIFHLRQKHPLSDKDQERYFKEVVNQLYDQDRPSQLLFSCFVKNELIGYGGLVHINWEDRNAEISFIMDPRLESSHFINYWVAMLKCLEELAFVSLNFNKIYTYAYDLRPKLYEALKISKYTNEAILKEHVYINGVPKSVLIHSKLNNKKVLRKANRGDWELTYKWAKDPNIRKYSFNQSQIDLENHLSWFYSKLSNENSKYYILCLGGSEVGSIRFDIIGNEAIVSYLIDTKYTRKRLGTDIILLGIKRLLLEVGSVDTIVASVMPANVSSIRIFEKLGFKKEKLKQAFKFTKLVNEDFTI